MGKCPACTDMQDVLHWETCFITCRREMTSSVVPACSMGTPWKDIAVYVGTHYATISRAIGRIESRSNRQ